MKINRDTHHYINKSFLFDISKRSEIERLLRIPFNSRSIIGYYLSWYYLYAPEEYACVTYLDKYNHFIKSSPLQIGDYKYTDLMPEKIKRESKLYSATSFIIAHNHKDKPLIPSPEDIATTQVLYNLFKNEQITFYEHYIISGFNYVTLLSKTDSICKYNNT